MENEEIKNIDDMELSEEQLDQVAGGKGKRKPAQTKRQPTKPTKPINPQAHKTRKDAPRTKK